MTDKSQRLDKVLTHMGIGTRKEIKQMAKKGKIKVNAVITKDPGQHVVPTSDQIEVNGEVISYQEYIYLMLNKPPGILSATKDRCSEVVLDLLTEQHQSFQPFPVGRLDKDTEGLLLLTNDGKLTHKLLSPKKHVPKTYFAKIKGQVTEEDIDIFSKGVTLEDGYHTLPGQLTILASGELSEIELTIYEGKFHQVKRMFEAVGKKVTYLKRLSMGPLKLDKKLELGEYRELTAQEVQMLEDVNK